MTRINRHKELLKTLIDIDGTIHEMAAIVGCSPRFVGLVSTGERNSETEMGAVVDQVIQFVIKNKRIPAKAELAIVE